MPYTNMGELKAGIADWLNREDLTAVIPDFISLAQNRINKDVRLRGYDNQYYQAQEVAGFNKRTLSPEYSPCQRSKPSLSTEKRSLTSPTRSISASAKIIIRRTGYGLGFLGTFTTQDGSTHSLQTPRLVILF